MLDIVTSPAAGHLDGFHLLEARVNGLQAPQNESASFVQVAIVRLGG